MLGELKAELKQFLLDLLGPAYDYVMPSISVLLPFLNPGALYWLYLLTAVLLALYLYLTNAAVRTGGPSARGFLRFLAPKEVYGHPSAWLDCKYFVINSLVHQHFKIASFAFLVGGLLSVGYGTQRALEFVLGPAPAGAEPTVFAKAVYTLVIVAATDFSKWVTHYLQHRIQYLWEFHKVHHSAEVLTPLTNLRVHPVDVMFENFLAAIVSGFVVGAYGYWYSGGVVEITILGTSAVYFVYLIFVNLRHSHIPFAFPRRISKVLCSPLMHQFHHSADSKHYNKNFSVVFSLWDYLAGTIYLPQPNEKPQRLGIGEESAAFHSVLSLYFYPFSACARRLRNRLTSARA